MDASHKYESGKTPKHFLHAIVTLETANFLIKQKWTKNLINLVNSV